MKMKISILNTFLPGPSVMISWVMDAPLTSLFAYTLFCRLRNELDRKYAPIRMQFESSQQ